MTKPRQPAEFRRTALLVLTFNTLIAVFLRTLVPRPFGELLIISQSIGLSIFLLNIALTPLRSRVTLLRWGRVFSIPLGGALGALIASLLGAKHSSGQFFGHPGDLALWLGCALVFGAIISNYFHSREELAAQAARLREEELARATNEQKLVEANLKMLQAQMEPHVLFNTLSNILGLIDERPADAKQMLSNFTSYLRGSLQRTREGATTLGDEADLLRAYLEIQAVRMGRRLRYTLDVPDELRGLPLPPLLLQPLVENAVRHGLEHRLEGGEIEIRAAREDNALVLRVRDTGVGLSGDAAPGIGLANVKVRLQALYGAGASMVIRPNQPQGLSAEMTIPLKPPAR